MKGKQKSTRKTLGELLKENPQWLDLDVGIYTSSGDYVYLGERCIAYEAEDENGKTILVFDPN